MSTPFFNFVGPFWGPPGGPCFWPSPIHFLLGGPKFGAAVRTQFRSPTWEMFLHFAAHRGDWLCDLFSHRVLLQIRSLIRNTWRGPGNCQCPLVAWIFGVRQAASKTVPRTCPFCCRPPILLGSGWAGKWSTGECMGFEGGRAEVKAGRAGRELG